MNPETIPKPYAIETCKLGKLDKCCRYLAVDKDGFCCLKGTSLKDTVDGRAKRNEMTALSDNCEGWNVTI